MLDADMSGELDVDEFCSAIVRVTTSDLPPDQIRMRKQIEVTRKIGENLQERLQHLEDMMAQIVPRRH